MKKLLKRLTGPLLILALVGILAGCGADPTPTPPAPTNTPVPTPTATLAPGVPTPTPAPPTPTAAATPTPVATPTPAFDAAAHFKGKVVRFIVSSNPGGSTDLEGRMVAKWLGAFIPGKPRVVVSNIPRIPGYHAAYEARPDGYTIGMTVTGDLHVRRQILDEARYDVRLFQHLGTMGSSPTMVSMTSDLGYADVYAAMGAGSDAPQISFTRNVAGPVNLPGQEMALALICEELALPCRFFNVANDTSAQMLVMLERGEITGYARAAWERLHTLRPGWWTEERLVPLFNMTPNLEIGPNPETGQIYPAPGIDELLSPEAYLKVQAMQGTGLLSKNYWYQPDVPAEIVAAMREVFVNISRDPDYNETMKRVASVDLELGKNFITGEETDRIQQEGVELFLETQDKIAGWQEYYFDKYWR
jgi:tripartite-type tricarboxylate transporter receptor subunit TctC